MSEEKQEGQKTIVSFIVGLLIGGLLVWAFSSPVDQNNENKDKNEDKKEMTTDKEGTEEETESSEEEKVVETPVLEIGDGKVTVGDVVAGNSVTLSSVTYPVSEGWIGVRDYNDGRLGGVLGVSRFSESQNLVPKEIILQRATEKGKTYAVVVFTESGDRQFSMADDVQLDSVFATFTAK